MSADSPTLTGAAGAHSAAWSAHASPSGGARSGARAWFAALRMQTRKELRDLLGLALGVSVAAALGVALVARSFGMLVPVVTSGERVLLAAFAALCALPLVAEALCADSRTGMARATQGWPTTTALVMTAKALSIAVYVALFAVVLVSAAAACARPVHLPSWELTFISAWAARAAGAGLVAVALCAGVTRHSLASLLAGVAALLLHVVPMLQRADSATRSFEAARALARYADAPLARHFGWLCALSACALLAVRLRGRATRSVVRRSGAVAAALTLVVGLWSTQNVPGAERAARLTFGDPYATVERTVVAPDGGRVALALMHHGAEGRAYDQTWWLVDLTRDAAPRRLSTTPVAHAAGLGTGAQIELLAWSRCDDKLLGWSSLQSDFGTQTTWSLDPETLDVRRLPSNEYAEAIGETLQRRTLHPDDPTSGAPSELAARAPGERWSLRDGSHALDVPCAVPLGAALAARGVGFFLDEVREVHRVDLLAGTIRPLGIVTGPGERGANLAVSEDGRWLVHSKAGRPLRSHVLLDTLTLESTTFEARHYAFGQGDVAVVVPLAEDGAPEPGAWGRNRRFRAVSLIGQRDLDFEVDVEGGQLYSLPDGRWISRSDTRRVVTLHAADGRVLRALRAPATEVTP
ncbi:MAG: hypothetical protein R3F49_21755 [Planctomycetota bacterium]